MIAETTALRVLILEDVSADAGLMLEELRRHAFEPAWERVDTEEDYLARLGAGWDVILADYTLPAFDALRALALMQDRGLDIPFIIVTGTLSDEAAVLCLKSGASDYLRKDRLARLGPAVERALAERRAAQESRRQQEILRDTTQKLQALVQASPVAIIILGNDGLVSLWNPAAERLFGWTEQEVLGTPLPTIPPEGRAEFAELRRRMLAGQALTGVEVRRQRKDGAPVTVSVSQGLIRNASGEVIGAIGMITDLTEPRRMEAQLRQSQKMEAVGQLAGGIAHDFNNLLTVITGRAELALHKVGEDGPAGRDLTLIRQTAERAAAMTRQLLAFSRRQTLAPRVVDPNQVVQGLLPMLRRLIGEDMELIPALDPGVGRMRADVTRVEQVILNLVVNARDAMPQGGPITLETANVELGAAFALDNPGAPSGPHVMLAVRDRGMGMDGETQDRIFEPFFTTKGPGQGTGLGLATVYGIVRQHEGWIKVESAPGRGTTMRVYLRRVEEGGEPAGPPAAGSAAPRGSETILLVEDDETVRQTAQEMLEMSGYRVIETSDTADSRRLAAQHRGPIHLLLTDVIMPGMSGPALAAQVASLRPGIRVLYMSGYTGDALGQRGMVEPDMAFLQKPFTPEALARKVRETLDDAPAAGGSR
ncbi:MAG: hypothetical protein A2X52_13685 [Candidatus Rokubacteria bacterium GWC2_70_16]|nr:MAG: hypothetical protein A2X52_13685 [Candidatus Rokubacteria bacterium GWC2_70_16]